MTRLEELNTLIIETLKRIEEAAKHSNYMFGAGEVFRLQSYLGGLLREWETERETERE